MTAVRLTFFGLFAVASGSAQGLLGNLPIYLVANRGQYASEVAFYAEGREKTVFFTAEGLRVVFPRGEEVRIRFVGARKVRPRGRRRAGAVFSYFLGRDPSGWRGGVPSYEEIVYPELWPGIDLVYRGLRGKLKYRFVVRPGADPGRIRLRYEGVAGLDVRADGGLLIRARWASWVDEAPTAQAQGRAVAVGYRLLGRQTVGFEVGQYPREATLHLDPAFLMYCGYIGGAMGDTAFGLAVDAAGYLYVAGGTGSSTLGGFPARVGPGLQYGGDGDVFVAKVTPDGRQLVYCGYLGGKMYDRAYGIAVDAQGAAYVVGIGGPGYPLVGGRLSTVNWGASVTKVHPSGKSLVYSGVIGPADHASGIAVDSQGAAYVIGQTRADERIFPVKVGPDLTFNSAFGETDVFVAKVDPQGKGLVYCGYIGGEKHDYAGGIAVDDRGRAYVTGTTWSDERTFPVKVGPRLRFTPGGLFAAEAFVARVKADGTALEYCGYIGGDQLETGYGIAVDRWYRAYVVGQADSDERTFPVKVGPSVRHGAWDDAFVARVKADGSGFEYCGYIGGEGRDHAWGVAVDRAGAAYVVGLTFSSKQFPLKVGPDLTYNGEGDAFVAKVRPDGRGLVYCGYIGGYPVNPGWRAWDIGYAVAVDRWGNAYVGGQAVSDEKTFPVKVGPDLTYNGPALPPPGDAFVAKVALVLLEGPKTVSLGGTAQFQLTATESGGLPYVMGSSFGTGPIVVDKRQIRLSSDALLWTSLSGLLPELFRGYRGVIGPDGRASAQLVIPEVPGLLGVKIHSAFVTLDGRAPSGIRAIANTWTVQVGP